MTEPTIIPDEDEWTPPGYEQPADDNEPVTSVHEHGDEKVTQ